MRNHHRISALRKHSSYRYAHEVLDSILRKQVPSNNTLTRLYGARRALHVRNLISSFLTNELPTSFTPRLHNTDAPNEISETRRKLESNEVYQNVQEQLLREEMPDIAALRILYGEYAEAVNKVFNMFLELGLKRRCGIPSAAHLNRVGALAGALGLDENQGGKKYSAIGALHDAIEDLLNRITDSTGARYGLSRYTEFLNDFIPSDLQSALILLTNHYDLILSHVERDFRKRDLALTKDRLLNSLAALAPNVEPELTVYINNIIALLEGEDLGQDIYENAKWRCYRMHYIHDMAATAHSVADYRTYQTKALDISDNANGREALALSGRIKNILKMDIWGREGYALGSQWSPLNNHIIEFEEDALVHAEHLVLEDFLEPVLVQDFFMSGLGKIKTLAPVFFIDEMEPDLAATT